VQQAQDVGDDQRASERADKRRADGDSGDVEHAAPCGCLVIACVGASRYLIFVSSRERAGRWVLSGEGSAGILNCGEAVQDHVEIFDRSGTEPGIDDVSEPSFTE
jgi:hypothetical protein